MRRPGFRGRGWPAVRSGDGGVEGTPGGDDRETAPGFCQPSPAKEIGTVRCGERRRAEIRVEIPRGPKRPIPGRASRCMDVRWGRRGLESSGAASRVVSTPEDATRLDTRSPVHRLRPQCRRLEASAETGSGVGPVDTSRGNRPRVGSSRRVSPGRKAEEVKDEDVCASRRGRVDALLWNRPRSTRQTEGTTLGVVDAQWTSGNPDGWPR